MAEDVGRSLPILSAAQWLSGAWGDKLGLLVQASFLSSSSGSFGNCGSAIRRDKTADAISAGAKVSALRYSASRRDSEKPDMLKGNITVGTVMMSFRCQVGIYDYIAHSISHIYGSSNHSCEVFRPLLPLGCGVGKKVCGDGPGMYRPRFLPHTHMASTFA